MKRINEETPVIPRGCAGAQRDVQRETLALSGAPLATGAGARVIRELMSGKIENGRVRPKDFLCAIAMVYVPIDDEYTFRPVPRLCVSSPNRGIVEKTKAHRL